MGLDNLFPLLDTAQGSLLFTFPGDNTLDTGGPISGCPQAP